MYLLPKLQDFVTKRLNCVIPTSNLQCCLSDRSEKFIIPKISRNYLTAETSICASGTFSYGYDSTSGGRGNLTRFKGSTNTFNADDEVTNTGYRYDGNGSPMTLLSNQEAVVVIRIELLSLTFLTPPVTPR